MASNCSAHACQPAERQVGCSAQNELNIDRELKSVLSYILYYEDECVTNNELRGWLN